MGEVANSENPGWVDGLAPLAWSPPAPVTWWLMVAVAALGHRYYLVRASPGSGLLGVLLAAPIALSAASIVAGFSWSTWH